MPKITQQSKSHNVPKLRFPEFSGAWEEKKLGTVGKFRSGQGFGLREQGGTKGTPFYKVSDMNIVGNERTMRLANHYVTNEQINKLKYKVIKEDSIIFAKVGAAIFLERKRIARDFLFDNNMMSFTPNVGIEFAKILFERIRLSKFAQVGALPSYNASDLSLIKVCIPADPHEQQKIAIFLGLVDSWIENLRMQKKSFESYKKGMMAQIFSQEIRFKNDKGKEFPIWKEKRLGEIGKTYNGLQGKNGDDFGTGEPFITYKQIFDDSVINIDRFALVRIKNGEKQNRAQFGDLFFTTSSETPLEVGFSSVLLAKDCSPYLNSFSFGLRPNSLKELDPHYASFFFRSEIYRKEVVKLAQGSTRYNISKTEFMKMKFFFPSFSEQHKIADFLTSLDGAIESKEQQITQAEQWKKWLMQEMFV